MGWVPLFYPVDMWSWEFQQPTSFPPSAPSVIHGLLAFLPLLAFGLATWAPSGNLVSTTFATFVPWHAPCHPRSKAPPRASQKNGLERVAMDQRKSEIQEKEEKFPTNFFNTKKDASFISFHPFSTFQRQYRPQDRLLHPTILSCFTRSGRLAIQKLPYWVDFIWICLTLETCICSYLFINFFCGFETAQIMWIYIYIHT